MEIAIDFDGTCVTHEYPKVGKNIGAEIALKKLVDAGHNLILFTMRDGIELRQAVQWFQGHDIKLYGVQANPTQKDWTKSPKCYAHLYIDDAALGVPLIYDKHSRPYVDWISCENLLVNIGLIK